MRGALRAGWGPPIGFRLDEVRSPSSRAPDKHLFSIDFPVIEEMGLNSPE